MKTFIIILFLLFCWSFLIEPNIITVKHITIEDKELKGLKVLFASDFHFKMFEHSRLKKTIKLMNEQNADIILLGGDYVSGHEPSQTMKIEKIANEFSKLKSKYGTFAVIGNHDGWQGKEQITKALSENNVHVLINENIKVGNFYIAGVDDIQTGFADMDKALKNIDEPVILLTHNPDEIVNVPETVNLTLAGHLHGGQICIPFIKSPVPSKFGHRFVNGLNLYKGRKIFTTKGLGTSILPFRFNCLPEIVIIDFI